MNEFDMLPQKLISNSIDKKSIKEENRKMTICIAAMCEDGKSLVVGADKEITAAGLSLKFSHDEKKIDTLTDKCVVLSAGDALVASDIIQKTKEKIKTEMSVQKISETLKENFIAIHLDRVEKVILNPLGYNWQEFKDKAGVQLPGKIYENVNQAIFNFGLNLCEFLIAGLDKNGAHIFRVFYAGMAGGNWIEVCDKLGYRAIGSGCPHSYAILAMSHQYKGLKLEDTLFNIYCAKKSAEMAPGVGSEEDFGLINQSGITFIDSGKIEELKKKRKEKYG